MKYRVRFHLLNGKYYMHWQIRSVTDNDQLIGKSKDAKYFDPSKCQIEMFGCKLVNKTNTARKVHTSGKKNVCGWILCDDFDVHYNNKLNINCLNRLTYNPIKDIHWKIFEDDENRDNSLYDRLITKNNNVYILKC